MDEMSAGELKKVVERLHNCEAVFSTTVRVEEIHVGELVWSGDVSVFWTVGHPTAQIAYA